MPARYDNIIEIADLSSTNDYATELAQSRDTADFTVVRTGFQTKGRGQRGNLWESARAENLLFSVVVHPREVELRAQFVLSQCVAVSVAETVALFCDEVMVKWPNDVYVAGKKIAGILIENILRGKAIETSVIGIGLNVNQTRFRSAPNPTSLALECGQRFGCDEVLALFLTRFRANYALLSQNPDVLRSRYMERLYLKGIPHTFADAGGLFQGTISAVAPDGKLLIIDTEGAERWYYFKEVRLAGGGEEPCSSTQV